VLEHGAKYCVLILSAHNKSMHEHNAKLYVAF